MGDRKSTVLYRGRKLNPRDDLRSANNDGDVCIGNCFNTETWLDSADRGLFQIQIISHYILTRNKTLGLVGRRQCRCRFLRKMNVGSVEFSSQCRQLDVSVRVKLCKHARVACRQLPLPDPYNCSSCSCLCVHVKFTRRGNTTVIKYNWYIKHCTTQSPHCVKSNAWLAAGWSNYTHWPTMHFSVNLESDNVAV